jgi:tetratricopeptide (TPR) repeat protein
MKHFSFLIAVFFLLNATLSQASSICGELDGNRGIGPFDYRNERRDLLKLVNDYHFSKNVEQLIAGDTGAIGGDLNFVLSTFPNHHRALETLSRLSIRDKTPRPQGARFTTLCYFERAVRFKPDDAMARLVFSNHLLKINKPDLALEQLLFAIDLEPDNPLTAYNLGLVYLKKRDYEKAVDFAKKAYSQDFPLQGLKQQLRSAGRWRE